MTIPGSAPSREVRLRRRPVGSVTRDCFEMAAGTVPPPAAGEVQVRNLWLSVDPYMRGRMNDRPSYVAPFELGEPLQGDAIGEVVASEDARYAPGDLVMSRLGWREQFTAPAEELDLVETVPGLPLQAHLGLAGMPGLTAYAGLTEVAPLRNGDVVLVTAAAGAVGSAACQIAKLRGHRVIGSAGGPEKAAFLETLGVDHVDHRAHADLTLAFSAAAPEGIDVCLENVGGTHLEAALAVANERARFALCGNISQYDNPDPVGPRNIGLAIGKRLQLRGFIVSDHGHLRDAFLAELREWAARGALRWPETVVDGLDQAPDALLGLFAGANTGKMLVRL